MYEEQVNLISSWLHDIDAHVADIHEVDKSDIDTSLQMLYRFEQEHAEKKPTVQNLRDKFNAVVGSDASEENSISTQYEDVIKKYEVSVVPMERVSKSCAGN